MFDAICLINALQNASGSLKKQEILRLGSEDENFCKLLYYALNPMLTYKISEQRLRTPVTYDPAITLTMLDIFDICECLSKRRALDDATVYQVCVFVQNMCPPHEMELYTKLLSKTLRLGVTAKTVNKVIPGLIPEWEVQQAYPIESHPIKNGTWFSLTQKLNGVRATYYKGRLYARSGIPYEGLDHITNVLNFEDDSYVFDGELTLLDKGNLSDNEAFRVATGIINSDALYKTIVLQGEICGDGIQGNKYHISGYDFFAFNLIYPDHKCTTAEIKETLAPFGIKSVPIVEEGKALPETIAELVEYSKGKSVVRKEQKREGVVMRNVQNNISFKVINPDFLLAEKD